MVVAKNGNDMMKRIIVGIVIGLMVAGASGFVGYIAASNDAVGVLEKKHDQDCNNIKISITEIQTTNKYTKEKLDEISLAVKELQQMMRNGRP